MKAGPRFVLITPSGHGNLGDAAIQDAVIAQIRARFPQADIVAATLNPQDSERRHGVRAFPLIGASRTGHGMPDQEATGTPDGAPPRRSAGGSAPIRNWLARVARAVLPAGWPRLLRLETQHMLAAFRLLRGTTAVIVSGGGQLDEFWGGPWGHPWTLFKWAALARLRRARVLVLSTGLGTLETRTGRWLAGRALALAHFRSYRDSGSKALMRAAGFARDDQVVPDIAYATPLPAITPHPRPQGSALTVGVSPIVYCDPQNWPRQDGAVFEAYQRRLDAVIGWLRADGHRVVLLSSNGSDGRLAQAMFKRLRTAAAPGSPGTLELADTGQVASFLCVAAKADIVVASRLHGVLLTHLTGTPVIALSHDRKVDAHMLEMDREAFRLDIEHFDLAQFQAAFHHMASRVADLRGATLARVAALRQRVLEQFEATLRV